MAHMKLEMSTQIYGHWRQCNNADSEPTQCQHRVWTAIAATVTSVVMRIPSATISVCSISPSTLTCLCNNQRLSSAVAAQRKKVLTCCWDLRYAGEKCFQPVCSLDTVSYWQENVLNATETLAFVNTEYSEVFFLQGSPFLSILKMHWWYKNNQFWVRSACKQHSLLNSNAHRHTKGNNELRNELLRAETQQKAQCYFMDPLIGDHTVPNYQIFIPNYQILIWYKLIIKEITAIIIVLYRLFQHDWNIIL